MLNKAFPNDAPKRTTVFEWHSRFKAGRISIEDDPRQRRPKFQRTDENVQKITDLIKENPRTTLLELEQDTGISKTTIGRIVTEDLKLKKTPAKFIPRFLTNEQKLCRLATCEDMMEMTRTDPEWKDKIITGDETWVYGYDPETKPQSAEWRDIAPNDFFLFPKLKAVLKVRHFDTRDDIIEKSPLALKSIPKEAYKNCFDNWEKRWRWRARLSLACEYPCEWWDGCSEFAREQRQGSPRGYSPAQNMRAGIDAQSFSQWLLKVGDGDLPTDQQGLISLPESCIFHGVDLVQEIFGSSYGDITALSQSVILTPKNTDSLEINEKVLDRLPNRSQCFLSVDSVECENVEEQNNYPTEFLNSLTPTGMPPHRLNLKIGAIVMLLRNLNPKQGLCNGTRMVIQRMRSHVLEAQILTGTKVGQTVLVPKISLAPSDTNLPFILKRRQFPLRLAFAMTINKAQGQTFARRKSLLTVVKLWLCGSCTYPKYSSHDNHAMASENGSKTAVTQDRGHCDCCDRDVWRHLRLFFGHNNNNNTVYTPKIENIAVIEMYGDI
ncbi:hypothetical protein LAZ67_1004740 [Cordylochernes scorpioides]|uniref:DNA helicase Pif1-like 2B domain-containing protein n=1 Tax=Cordylochernes scorpioides TaxID=51811 RepID=A0ABY6JXP6_9ARAC|nr:hypothetical protein LAZ67_1004740 [Cordylochernes scorpioides]